MQSVIAFHDLLVRNGISARVAPQNVFALSAHAMVCRARADAPSGAFREFVTATGRMTRDDKFLRIFNDTGDEYAEERRAACEALHDLIMEGV